MTHQTYLDAANRYYLQHSKDQRYGQAMMNFLYLVSPWAYAEVTGSTVDPFYCDDLVPDFLNYLSNNWDHWFTLS